MVVSFEPQMEPFRRRSEDKLEYQPSLPCTDLGPLRLDSNHTLERFSRLSDVTVNIQGS